MEDFAKVSNLIKNKLSDVVETRCLDIPEIILVKGVDGNIDWNKVKLSLYSVKPPHL